METKFYTMLIYSENFAGILNQITAVFTRRQVNIESLNVCASSTPGVHKYTITCNCTEEMAKMLTKQIEKKIDVLQARTTSPTTNSSSWRPASSRSAPPWCWKTPTSRASCACTAVASWR